MLFFVAQGHVAGFVLPSYGISEGKALKQVGKRIRNASGCER